jgi:hypothetical protein
MTMNMFRYQSPSAETTTNTNSKPQNTGTPKSPNPRKSDP